MRVPSTPTAFDKKKEVLEIQLEINKLKSVIETEQRRFNEVLISVEQLIEKKEDLVSEIESLNGSIIETSKETKEFIGGCQKILNESNLQIENTFKLYKVMADKIEELKKEIVELKEQKEVIHKNIVEENEQINKSRRDLNIYQSRLEKYFKEFMPNHKIIL